MTPMVSVIVPIYNVETYISDCLESISRQTYRHYEVIIVNDGSTDRSAEIAEKYIQKNCLSKWKVLHKQNGGISSARNSGIRCATGEWIFFLDSDDWLAPNALEALTDCLEKYPSDLVIGGCYACDQMTGTKEVWSAFPCEYGVLPNDLGTLHSFSFCWGRLYKKSIIDAYNLCFDERIKYAEDNAWQFDYNRRIKSFSCTNEAIYNYRINREGSLTSRNVNPRMKYYIAEYMYAFYAEVDKQRTWDSLRENPRLLSVTWGVLTTDVVNHILNKEYSAAREKMTCDLAKAVEAAFAPRSKKEQIFLWLWQHSFPALCAFVKLYYGNFDLLHNSKFMRMISKRK